MSYIPRFLMPPQESFFLFGPRGTGKSTWLRHSFPEALWIDLLDAAAERHYAAYPERLRESVVDIAPGSVCVIDEVQRVPHILPIVHSLIEEKRGIQFILTGSGARKLRRSSSDLLGGRALLRYMQPFLAGELGSQFQLKRALRLGLVPMVWESPDAEEKLRAYVGIYLREEVQAEGWVRQIGDFARFMEVASFSHASLLNTTQIARDAHVKRPTVDNYLQILEDLLLAFRLRVFTRRATRKMAEHSKFYYFDAGVFWSMRPRGPMDSDAELEGQALEGLVAQHLRAWVAAQHDYHQLAFWRTSTGVEVDFIVYGARGFWAIEVKRSADLCPADVHGLTSFQEEYPEAQVLLLYGGTEPITYRGVLCLPVSQFLMQVHPERAVYDSQ